MSSDASGRWRRYQDPGFGYSLIIWIQFSISIIQSPLLIIWLVSANRVNIVLSLTRIGQNSMDTHDWNQIKSISHKNNLRISVIIQSAFICLRELVSFSKNATRISLLDICSSTSSQTVPFSKSSPFCKHKSPNVSVSDEICQIWCVKIKYYKMVTDRN